jgi:hypothetical protein
MKRMLLLLGLISAATGCFSVPRTPPDLVSIRCDTVDSARVAVPYAELIRVNDQVVLVGKVGRVYWGADTSATHLDVAMYAADGSVLRALVAEFTPRQIYGGRHLSGRSEFRVVLESLPLGLARIEVRAHEGEHGSR